MHKYLNPPIRLLGLAFLILLMMSSYSVAEIATVDEARLVSQNWLTYLTSQKGTWAGSANPKIGDMQEMIIDGTVHAYCFAVEPKGFIMIPVLKELSPIKAYSDENNLNLDDTGGMAVMLKDVMQHRIGLYIETYGSLDASQPEKGVVLFGREQREAWDDYLVSEEVFNHNLAQGKLRAAKDVGPLLTTNWHQTDPYDRFCPWGWGGRCVVGCVSTAAVQIMRYHQWPIVGVGNHTYYWPGDTYCPGSTPVPEWLTADFIDPYDWDNMPNNCDGGCTGDEQDALAELSYEVAVAFNMDFSHCGSGAYTSDAEMIFPTYFRYKNQIARLNRSEIPQELWSSTIQTELEASRPILYSIILHSIVCDGWRETGTPDQVHMNYGWGGAQNMWYTIDNLYCADPGGCPPNWYIQDYMMVNIEPDKRAYFTSDTLWGNVPLPVNFSGYSSEEISDWDWTFGDGGTADIQSPQYTYNTSGQFDVKLLASTSSKATYQYLATKYITALADSLIGENVTGEAGDDVKVSIFASNTIPIYDLRIPVEYSGSISLQYDSFNTDGCRTDYFDHANRIAFDPGTRRAVYRIYNDAGTADLTPGSGPVLNLYFSIPGGATPDQGAQIGLEGFWTYSPIFYGRVVPEYEPRLVAGSVSLPFFCGDVNSDTTVNIFDVTYIIGYLYMEGPPPDPMKAADVNADCAVNIFDVTALINYLYMSGPEPNCPGVWPCK